MTYEQIIEELKKLKAHNNTVSSEQQAETDANVNAEVEEIDAAIEDYNEKIAALEARIANESNYQYNSENEERDLTIEILEESFENQLEVMNREDEEYKNLQDLATTIFTDYNLEIATLNTEIATIERRLRKNDIAVRKNIGIRLTDEELFSLNSDLEQKKSRIKECEEMKAKYVEDLSNYGELITVNNRKREVVLSKQESLNKIKEHRDSKIGTIDNVKLRNDKDELASLKAGLSALISRKDYITYNPNAEIDKLIEAIEQNKNLNNEVFEKNKNLDVDVSTQVMDDSKPEDTMDNQVEQTNEAQSDEITKGDKELDIDVSTPVIDETLPEETLENQVEEPTEDKAQSLIDAYLDGNEDLVAEKKDEEKNFSTPLGIPEKTSAEVGLSVDPNLWPEGNPDLNREREAEIEEASKVLKEKKKQGWFKKNWKKWVAAGLATIALLAAIKGCSSNKKEVKPEDYTTDNTSQSQTDEEITDENQNEFNSKYEVPVDNVDNNVVSENNYNKNDTTQESVVKQNPTPEVKPTPDPIPNPEPTPNPIPDPIPEPTPDPEPSVEKEEVELEQGEAIIGVEDILKGNINKDTVIEHGDEVGKTTDNAELKDYTEEGNAVVEYEKAQENNSVSDSSSEIENKRDQIISNLEEFMGGDLTFTDQGNQWLDEISSGKQR